MKHRNMRQQDIDYQHAVCDAHTQFEHLRPKTLASWQMVQEPMEEEVNDLFFEIDGDPCPMEEPTTMREAAKYFASRHRISVQELLGHCRKKYLIPARKDFVGFCKGKLGKSLNQIGQFMDGRDHTSILHYMQLIKRDELASEERAAA